MEKHSRVRECLPEEQDGYLTEEYNGSNGLLEELEEQAGLWGGRESDRTRQALCFERRFSVLADGLCVVGPALAQGVCGRVSTGPCVW